MVGESPVVAVGPALAVVLILLAVTAIAVAYIGRTGYGSRIGWAVVRATVQLILLGLLVAAIMDSLALSAAFIAVIAAVSSYTAAARIVGRRPRPRDAALTATAVAVPALVVVGVLLALGVIPLRGIAIIPIAGIVMGGAMAAAGLAGRHAREAITARWGEVEAGLALGLPAPFIRWEVCGRSAGAAIIPHLDQTRTVGLVSIPGAFVGMMLGGASPAAAAAMQLLVLVAILCCGSIAALLVCRYVAEGWYGQFRPDASSPPADSG
ncbi:MULTISPECIES: ABC transporter permease [Actinomycetes]|uniref:ABC transporter permease n=1 Tax=Tsukamurella TaxID=2060 RepID=UPI001C7DBA17|nr:ABC transporter permease [Tsukamurella sp. TY48]